MEWRHNIIYTDSKNNKTEEEKKPPNCLKMDIVKFRKPKIFCGLIKKLCLAFRSYSKNITQTNTTEQKIIIKNQHLSHISFFVDTCFGWVYEEEEEETIFFSSYFVPSCYYLTLNRNPVKYGTPTKSPYLKH